MPEYSPDKDKQDLEDYQRLIKALDYAVTNAILYPVKHPAREKYLNEAYTIFTELLIKKEVINISRQATTLIVNDLGLDDTKQFVKHFFDYFKKLKVDSIEFSMGLSLKEVDTFIGAMAMSEEEFERKGTAKGIFSIYQTAHIKVKPGRFKMVSEGQVVASEDQVITGAEAAKGIQLTTKKAEVYRAFSGYLEGRILDPALLKIDEQVLVNEILKNPREIARFILDIAKETQDINAIVERLGEWLLNLLRKKKWASRKDMAQVMEGLHRSIQNALSESKEIIKEPEEASKKLSSLVEDYAQKIKVDTIMTNYLESSKKTPAVLSKFFYKFVKTQEEKEKLLLKIEERLKDICLPEKEIEKSLKKIKDTPFKEAGYAKVSYSELRHIYEREKKLNEEILSLRKENEELKSKITKTEELPEEAPREEKTQVLSQETEESGFTKITDAKLKIILKVHALIYEILENLNLLAEPDTGSLNEEQKRIIFLLKKHSEELELAIKNLLPILGEKQDA